MDKSFFSQNRARLRQLVAGNQPIIVAASGLLQRNGDTTFPFRQDSNFYYLTGINEPDLVLVIDKSSEYLIVPGRSSSRESFDGALDFSELSATSGVGEILGASDGWLRLKSTLAKNASVATPLASSSYIAQHGFFTNPARARLIKKLRSFRSRLELVDIREVLATMRMVKQLPELNMIQKAIDITAEGIEKVAQNIANYKYEYEIEASLSASFRAGGASGHAFAPIVASGKNACTLHNVSNNSRLHSSDLVTLDVGAEYNNYAADITRTLSLGQASPRQKQVYDAVLDVQNYGLGLLKPGVDIFDYESKIVNYMGKKLVELGLITKITGANVRKYYPHSTGHFMGLDVHDAGDYRQPLAENVVLTCEPGIYIPEESIGVRIEDDVLITTDGNRVLSPRPTREFVVG